MKWTWENGQEKIPLARSDLACPNVIRDGLNEPLRHQADGRMYESKRAFERATKDAGCVCIGNESPKTVAAAPPPFTVDEVGRAAQQVKDGYKPNPQIERDIGTESGWI
jgi:hypothetical protein